jgi:hypothetical protein
MSLSLTNYKSITSGLLVRLDVQEYKVNSGDTPTPTVLKFSDLPYDINITWSGNAETYTSAGRLLSITPSRSELRSGSNTVTVTLSGIPSTRLSEILNSKIKGSPIAIMRVILGSDGSPASISGNPFGRFFGVVTNYSLEEDWNSTEGQTTNSINLICASWIDVFDKKITGRATSPYDEKAYFPSDVSMDRVPNLVGSNFNFGDVTK